MKKVCLLIGEGDSERYFFPKILERKSFVSLSQKEGQLSIYGKADTYWFFVYPPHFGNDISGKEKLKKPDTYRLASAYVNNNKHLFGDDYELHLVVVFDTDGASEEERKKEIENAVTASGITLHNKIITPVYLEIESWYFAGVEDSFPYFFNKDTELTKLLSTKTTNEHTKENFRKYIDLDKMIGAKEIAQAISEHFKEDKAQTYSDSFKNFYSLITTSDLF